MRATYAFSDTDRDLLAEAFCSIDVSPYRDYKDFRAAVGEFIRRGSVPAGFVQACLQIKVERDEALAYAHLISNCPLDKVVPVFDQDDSVEDKYRLKSTFVGEAILEVLAQLTETPLLAYVTRNNGDLFHDVYADNKYLGTQTQKSDGELFWHNDRTAHPVRADYLALLGMRCPDDDLVYTKFIDGRSLLANISLQSQELLRESAFVTPYDELSRASNANHTVSDRHPVLENTHSFRYYDTRTTPADETSAPHYEALRQFRDALAKSDVLYHRIQDRDLLVIANQDGLHSRQMVDVKSPDTTRLRWLLKTYAFRNDDAADAYSGWWLDDVRGLVKD